MISRHAEAAIRSLAAQFPAVIVLGPRQCGKITLVRHFLDARYFDLEKPSDLQIFASDIEYALRNLKAPLILDEAQALPELFPVLRALIDETRRARGRFFLLGSVNPELIKSISETLAGRAGVVELTPFLFSEIAGRRGGRLEMLWLRGGFPDAFLARTQAAWTAWQESYMRTFIERDIARHRLTLSSIEMRRLMTMLAHAHGGVLNYSDLGRSLGYSYHTVQNALDLLEGYFLVRRLPPYYANLGKRLVRSPKVYVRDSGVLHHLLGIGSAEQLLVSPTRGASFEGFMIEQIVSLERLHRPSSQFYFFRTHAGLEIDLLIDRGRERIGIELKAGVSIERRDWTHLQGGIESDVIQRGVVLYNGTRAFPLTERIRVVPAADAVGAADW